MNYHLTLDIYTSAVRAESAGVGSLQTATTPEDHVAGHGVVLFDSPQGFWLAPSIWNGTLYGPSMQNANWHFTQWQTPGRDLPPFIGDTTATEMARVMDFGGSWEIAQSGENLPPGDEFSVFAEANQSHVYPFYRPAGQDSEPLSKMQFLHHTIGFESKYEYVLEDDGLCQAGFLTAVVLKNTENGDRLFYQLVLRQVNSSPFRGWWYWSGPRWGYTDNLLTYDMPVAPFGERVYYQFDLLPKLTGLFQTAYNGIDTDLSHWVVTGTYHGSHVWGGIRLTSVWDSFSMHAKYKNQ